MEDVEFVRVPGMREVVQVGAVRLTLYCRRDLQEKTMTEYLIAEQLLCAEEDLPEVVAEREYVEGLLEEHGICLVDLAYSEGTDFCQSMHVAITVERA